MADQKRRLSEVVRGIFCSDKKASGDQNRDDAGTENHSIDAADVVIGIHAATGEHVGLHNHRWVSFCPAKQRSLFTS